MLFNVLSQYHTGTISAGGHSETWSIYNNGERVPHNHERSLGFAFVDYDADGDFSYARDRDITNVNQGTAITAEQEAQTPDEITVEVGETGRVSFFGLGTGTYWLTEAKAPDGYNLLDEPIKLVVSFNHETGTFHYDWRHEGAATALSATMTIQIVNTKGNVLPETGGMGTTLFYAFGGTMVLAAPILLVMFIWLLVSTRKRK